MQKKSIAFSSARVDYYFDGNFSILGKLLNQEQAVIITDENVFAKHKAKLKGWRCIVISAGEQNKNQTTIDYTINKLIELGADRQTILVGIGGGVVTDITGFVASIYMRGLKFGFVPTSILGMVDAAIGGKNGIDVGLYKNMVGLIRQPSFILFDYAFLKTLPNAEWINGFAEVIKHACIKDAKLFSTLEQHSIAYYKKDASALAALIKHNVLIKTKIVTNDEFEIGERKLLNFGHTIGHAIENLYRIPHGHAISIGMGVACNISIKRGTFNDCKRVLTLLKQYGLPPLFEFDKKAVGNIILKDKKKEKKVLQFIILKKIGLAIIEPIEIGELSAMLTNV